MQLSGPFTATIFLRAPFFAVKAQRGKIKARDTLPSHFLLSRNYSFIFFDETSFTVVIAPQATSPPKANTSKTIQ